MSTSKLFDSATLRLTGWYVLILMMLSLLFSGMLYHFASEEFNRAFGPRGGERIFIDNDYAVDIRRQMIADSNQRLLTNLVFFNLCVLAGGGGLSYLLARRTLRPIEDALESQSRFSSDAAHELRTPLAVMQSEIEVGLRTQKPTLAGQRELLKSNLDEVHRMQTLTDRLLLLANNHDVELAPVDIEIAAVDAMNRVITPASQKRIAIDNNVASVTVLAHQDSLTDVITILLDNAIKYSPAGSTITLASEQRDKDIVVQVIDQGIGMKSDDIDHIFDRFYRADTSRSKMNVEGYGLGLSIAKRLMDLQGGHIEVASKVGKGSTFTLRLPAA